jgi:hypothetical protein
MHLSSGSPSLSRFEILQCLKWKLFWAVKQRDYVNRKRGYIYQLLVAFLINKSSCRLVVFESLSLVRVSFRWRHTIHFTDISHLVKVNRLAYSTYLAVPCTQKHVVYGYFFVNHVALIKGKAILRVCVKKLLFWK